MLVVSLILTTYNCKDNLLRTLKSIDNQTYENIEVVIKDGGSTDGTLSLIQQYEKEHKNVIWKSSQDLGIYDALNQGIEMSTGDIIAVCNDMLYCADAISKIVNVLETSENDYIGVHSDLIYQEGEKIVRYWKMGQGTIYRGWMPGHPTLYLKREVYEQYGKYKINYRCSADYEFMIRVLKNNKNKLAYIPEVLISMYYGGTSNQGIGCYWTSAVESHRALRENNIRFAWGIVAIRTFKVIGQFFTRK